MDETSTCKGGAEQRVFQQEKVDRIQRCLAKDKIDLWELRELALTRGGLVNAEIRRKAWPILVGLDRIEPSVATVSSCESCDDADLIRRDAGRSVLFRYYKRQQARDEPSCSIPAGESTSQQDLSYSDQQERLIKVLEATILPNQKLHYYQGLHDIAGLLLHNLKETNNASAVLQRLCTLHLRDALCTDLTGLTWLLDTVVMPLMHSVDKELSEFVMDSELESGNAILPWIITWFTHDIHDEQVASRLMDAFLSSHALFPLYFAMAVLVHPQNRQEILYADCDPASIHMSIRDLLSHISNDWSSPQEGIVRAQELVDDAISLMRQSPPRSLLNLAGSYSGEDPQSYTAKAAFVSLLKSPPSWALASTMSLHSHQDDSIDRKPGASQAGVDPPVRAKITCGVPFLMSSVDETTLVSKRWAPQRKSAPTVRVSTRWELFCQIFFGNFTAEFEWVTK